MIYPYISSCMSPRKILRKTEKLRASEVAEILGMSERTLRRKLASGVLPEPRRDSTNNYRLWTADEVARIREDIGQTT